jgi:hypothetical protein
MSKLLLGIITAAVFAAGAASAQTAAPKPATEQNPEATCPVGANCAPQSTSQSTAAPAQSRPAASDATGSTARPSNEKNPEHTCPPGSTC